MPCRHLRGQCQGQKDLQPVSGAGQLPELQDQDVGGQLLAQMALPR